jgi:hypothetical protein
MAFVPVEDRVDNLEALFAQFMSEMALIHKRADERDKAAEERVARLEKEMGEFKDEMGEFKDEMSVFKDEMSVFKNEMRQSKKDMDKKWGDLANKLGTIVEDILAPNAKRLATEHFGFAEIEEIYVRWNRRRPNAPGGWEEFDLVITSADSVIVGEAKSTMNAQLADLYADKIKRFPEFAPHLAGLKVIPLLGCWSIPPQAVQRLTELGIYAMQMGGDTMELSNADELDSQYLGK